MRQDRNGGRGKGRRVAAHYQVTDLVIRRDWYSLANVFAASEVSEADMKKVGSLLESVSLDELVLLDTQLQLAGLSRVKTVGDIGKSEFALVIASGLELSRRRYYLQQECARDSSLETKYRRYITRLLRSGISYHYESGDATIALRATHRMMESLRRQTIDEEARFKALTTILRRDPQLLVGLVDDGYISLGEASDQLDESSIAPIDAIRLLVALPELLSKERVATYVGYLDLGAIAQLRDETSEQVVGAALTSRAEDLLETAAKAEDSGVSRYGGLYGNEYAYVAVRYERLQAMIVKFDTESVRGAIKAIDGELEANVLSKIPLIKKYDAAEALLLIDMLGGRFDWAKDFAAKLSKKYARDWLTSAQRVLRFDDRASLLDSYDRTRINQLNSQLSLMSFQLDISADEIAKHAPHTKKLLEILVGGKEIQRTDLMTVAYLAGATEDLCTQVARRIDDRACSDLLSAAIDGSSLARGFWQTLSSGDLLYLLLRWGNRTRNGYVLSLVAATSKRRYGIIYREAESRKLPLLSLAETNDALEVLAECRHRDDIASEQCLEFADQLAKTYGKQLAGRFVRNVGIRHAKELERFSPFYVRLLIDMQDDSSAIEQLKGKETNLTYEQAQEFREAYFAETRSFAKDVVASMNRTLRSSTESIDDAVVLKVV